MSNKHRRGTQPPATDSPAAAQRASGEPSAGGRARASAISPVPQGGDRTGRLVVRKTYKLFVGGAFPRSESGRSYPVYAAKTGELLAWAALASRKDVRDAVVAARSAVSKWAGATAYNRGQVLYRVAEMIEGRAGQFAEELVAAEGVSAAAARRTVAAVIDRWVWYAGWPDKVAQIAGASNPVAGPYFNFSVPEPTGVVA